MSSPRTASPSECGVAAVVDIAGLPLAFGLEWQPLSSPAGLAAEWRQARAAGFHFAAALPEAGLAGLARRIDGARRAHSAAALLVTRFSDHGAEACLIGAGRQVGFVGLMDRRPVPGFDRLLPDLDAAQALLQEFRDLHPGQNVRVASHLPGLGRVGEALSVDLLFERPDPETRLRPLPGRQRRTAGIAALAAGALLAAGLGAAWLKREHDQERLAAEQARDAAASAANRAAQAASRRASEAVRLLAAAGRPGAGALDRWRAAIARMPLSRAGWLLRQVTCSRADGCIATWTRHHGTLLQLDATWRASAAEPRPETFAAPVLAIDRQSVPDWLAAPMPAPLPGTAESPADAEPLTPGALPPLRDAVNGWGSRLQEMMLVGGGAALLDAGAPLVADASAATPRAVRLPWRLKDGLWSLPLLQIPPYVVVDSLTLNLGVSPLSYELSGSLFAIGDRY